MDQAINTSTGQPGISQWEIPPRGSYELQNLVETGQTVRIRIMYKQRASFCMGSAGMPRKATSEVPEVLAQKGLSRVVWQVWASKLADKSAQRPHTLGFVVEFFALLGIILLCATIVGLPLAWLIVGWRHAAWRCRVNEWNAHLLAWQTDFNKVLRRFGISCKSQSCRSPGVFSSYVERWIVFAVSEEQVLQLTGEPHLSGVIETDRKLSIAQVALNGTEWCFLFMWCCFCLPDIEAGIDEFMLCCHP